MLKKILVIVLALVMIAAVITGAVVWMPSNKEIDPITYFSEFKPGKPNLVFEDKRIDIMDPVIEIENVIYLSQEFAKNYIDDAIFYDQEEGILTITTLNEVIRMARGSNQELINGQEREMSEPLLEQNGIAYISENYLEGRYNFEIHKGKDERLYIASDLGSPKRLAVVESRKSELRTHEDHKSPIIDRVNKDDQVVVYSIENGYARVRDANGIIGFMKEKDIKITGETEVVKDKEYSPLPSKKPLTEKVKLVWDQLTVKTAGNWNGTKYANIKGANVISPTWFEFADSEGNLIDRGTQEYVTRAHDRGLQVWGLLSHNFTEPQLTKIILTSTTRRQRVIDQLLSYATQYQLDGINIDIENIQPDFSEEWVQFMRELYPQAKAKGLTLSVDVYMPSAWSGHYERAKISEVVDYFIVMAYDEHWSGSENAGPVA
ncbi:MAG: glycosyl hydrolase family 18 protein, partial [Cellulosilyticaceae bacterium]